MGVFSPVQTDLEVNSIVISTFLQLVSENPVSVLNIRSASSQSIILSGVSFEEANASISLPERNAMRSSGTSQAIILSGTKYAVVLPLKLSSLLLYYLS